MNRPLPRAKPQSNLRRSALPTSLAAAMFVCVLSGCSNPLGSGSNVEFGHSPGVGPTKSVAPARGSEFVSSSAQRQSTLGNRFILDGALASPTAQVVQKSPRGYTLYSNVQGQISSNQ